jgi:calpain-7
VTLTLQTNKDIPVNIAVVWSQGKRTSEFSAKELVATSGAYSYGLARASKNMSPGEYTVIASAFEPHYTGAFSLTIDSSLPFDFKPIAQEGAGMYTKVLRGSWESETAAGGPSFDRYSNNPVFELKVPTTTQLRIRLQLLQPSTAIALNVTVYSDFQNDVSASIKRQRHVTTSGAYDDAIAGVSTPQVTIGVGKYYIVPSTYNPGIEVGFRMLVYSGISGIQLQPADQRSGG